MFTTASKWFFGLGVVTLVIAAAYGWSTGGDGLGPVTLGYHGGVGDHLGYTILVSAGVLSLVLGLVAVATRDADAEALAQVAGTEAPPAALPPAWPAYWPVVGAFGAGLVVLGLVISNVLFVSGLIVLGAVLIEWAVLAWSDHATGDPSTNRQVRNRVLYPLEIPIGGALAVAVVAVGMSRVFLTVSKEGAVWVALAFSALVLLVGALVASRSRISSNAIAAVLAVGAVAVVAAGIVSAAQGERSFEHHGDAHAEGDHEGDGGAELRPFAPQGTNSSLDGGEADEEVPE